MISYWKRQRGKQFFDARSLVLRGNGPSMAEDGQANPRTVALTEAIYLPRPQYLPLTNPTMNQHK